MRSIDDITAVLDDEPRAQQKWQCHNILSPEATSAINLRWYLSEVSTIVASIFIDERRSPRADFAVGRNDGVQRVG